MKLRYKLPPLDGTRFEVYRGKFGHHQFSEPHYERKTHQRPDLERVAAGSYEACLAARRLLEGVWKL